MGVIVLVFNVGVDSDVDIDADIDAVGGGILLLH